jgi:hypothetical protein
VPKLAITALVLVLFGRIDDGAGRRFHRRDLRPDRRTGPMIALDFGFGALRPSSGGCCS